MQFELFTQQPKRSKIGVIGTLSIGKDGNAQLFSGHADMHSSVIGELHRVKIEWAEAKGILLSGVEPQGFDKKGCIRYRFQEWFLRYIER